MQSLRDVTRRTRVVPAGLRRPLEDWLGIRPGHVYGGVIVLLLLASKLDVRVRDPSLAVQGVVDTQILVELAIWTIAGAWITARLVRGRAWLMDGFPGQLGPGLKWYVPIGLMSLVSALLLRGSALTVVRALQLLVLLALAMLVQRDIRWGRAHVVDIWTAAARVLVLAVLALMVLGYLVPQVTSGYETYYGFARYRLLQMQPIGTAQLIGLALVACAVDLLLKVRRPSGTEQSLLLLAALVLSAGLWGTKARGAMIATVVAVVVLVLLTSQLRRRGALLLTGAALAVPLASGALDAALHTTLLRGQSEDELLSLTGRTELFGYAWQLFTERPVSGWGYLAARDMFLERFPWAGESHNAIVDIGLSLGLIGLTLYLGLLLTVIMSLRSGLRRSGPARELAVVGIALVAWLLLDGVGSDSYGGAIGPGLVALVLVVLISDDVRTPRDRDAGPAILHGSGPSTG